MIIHITNDFKVMISIFQVRSRIGDTDTRSIHYAKIIHKFRLMMIISDIYREIVTDK